MLPPVPPEARCRDAANNPGLVSDCDALLEARDTLAGSGSLNWSTGASIGQWVGVTVIGSPLRVTKLTLGRKGLAGEIPEGVGQPHQPAMAGPLR